VAPITEGASVPATGNGCEVGSQIGCVDAHWANHVLFATNTGNDMDLTLGSCARKCSLLGFKIMGVGWGGAGHGSNCLCGNTSPPASKLLKNDPECTKDPCSGNKTENCGGNWRTIVYSVHCAPAPPPKPSKKSVWIPPGDWLAWNTSASNAQVIAGGQTGKLLSGLNFALSEIPIFARAGSVVPTQTMKKVGGPLVWIIFPGAKSGNGSLYLDDGNTTKYQSTATEPDFSWVHLTHSTTATAMEIAIIGGKSPRQEQQQLLQLRRLAGAKVPTSVRCNGKALPKLATAASGSENGWWVSQASQDSLWEAAGSVMIALSSASSDESGNFSVAVN
jgi:hypothetical protein